MIERILIANRGEIAVRVIRTCREMGIRTVAVHSDVDRDGLWVMEADAAVEIGGADPSESYLNGERLVEAALRSGAQAVHPGYGFLSENGDFAEQCEAAGLRFIGPPASVIRRLGNKTEARKIAREQGVPVLPGTDPLPDDEESARRAAEEIGFPLLIKAAAGGGGKGMRVVESGEAFGRAWVAARREAGQAFGDDRVYLEKLLSAPRHVEVQVLADAHGHVIHLRERECSIQRRHQKLVEESPSTVVDEDLRRRMGDAAVAVARGCGYVNAGTVEFLVDRDGRFYFLEVNTRLQVEHPVTELLTGLDLVRLQVEVASGEPLAIQQDQVTARGHAIECRIYAEDPSRDFAPSPGRITGLVEPAGPGIRVDSGVHAAAEVPMHYDPILSKVIVHAPTRAAACDRMVRALETLAVFGVETTAAYLRDIVDSPAFRRGETTTDFVTREMAGWSPGEERLRRALTGAVLARAFPSRFPVVGAPVPGTEGEEEIRSPWQTLGGWRL